MAYGDETPVNIDHEAGLGIVAKGKTVLPSNSDLF
jgi:hypothetical protein